MLLFLLIVQVAIVVVIMLVNKIIYFVNITTPVESPFLLVLILSRKVRQISSCASIEIMVEETVKYFTLKLNYLQFETVRNLFNHSGWDFEDCVAVQINLLKQMRQMKIYKKMQSVNQELRQQGAAMMDLVTMMAVMMMVIILEIM